jgi:hypothetical protein
VKEKYKKLRTAEGEDAEEKRKVEKTENRALLLSSQFLPPSLGEKGTDATRCS